ncbi:MAG: hypothetical protein ACR2KZ_09240 [Segetibacter sp.]
MKTLAIAFLLSLSLCLTAQDNVIGRYRDYFGNRIQLNADNTFKYTWKFDLSASWTKGIWTLKNDTVFFHMVPTYDTLSHVNSKNFTIDTLILSDDEIPERITPIQSASIALSSGGQNRMACPDKLLLKKGRLYKIQNGSLVVKKQKGIWTSKKWDPRYFKSDD